MKEDESFFGDYNMCYDKVVDKKQPNSDGNTPIRVYKYPIPVDMDREEWGEFITLADYKQTIKDITTVLRGISDKHIANADDYLKVLMLLRRYE